MKKTICLAVAVLFALLCQSAVADVAAIHAGALPNDPYVAEALKDVTELEPYTHLWTPEWKYPIAKNEVAARLGKDLVVLSAAVRANPENVELLLLTGLAGRDAYNVDVSGVFDSTASVLSEAARLAPSDVRPAWFHASLLCQTADQPAIAAREFTAIEDSHAWQQLPPSFWTDYMECASVTNMPAHILRAANYLQKLHAPASDEVTFLTQTAQKRFDSFDPKKDYSPKEIWEGVSAGDDVTFTSTTCGLRLMLHGDWEVDQMELTKGSCVALFSTGPYETGSKKRPSILVMVQRPQNNQTLEAYSRKFLTKQSLVPFTPSRCPADHCIAMRGVKPLAYGKDGDGHALTLIFERDQPEFPGLIFESPLELPQPGADKGPQYYRPGQTRKRIPGKLYYVVLLDTAASIDEPAMRDFDFFLQNLIVE